MDATIQDMLDSVSNHGVVQLPSGEFEGPFTVTRPCTIQGQNTTLWADSGPVLVISRNAGNVYLQHLRVEIAGATGDLERVAIDNQASNLQMENIEVDGNVRGYTGEDDWILPKALNVGPFAADQANTFTLKILTNSDAQVISNINGITVSPRYVYRGLNTITIQTEELRARTCLYGEILFQSAVVRRIYVAGQSRSDANTVVNKNLFDVETSPLYLGISAGLRLPTPIAAASVNDQRHVPDGTPRMSEMPVPPNRRADQVAHVTPTRPSQAPVVADPAIRERSELQRGQRLPLPTGTRQVKLRFSHETRNVTVDTYAFQLAGNDRVIADEGLIFFGNDCSADGSLQLTQGAAGDEFLFLLDRNPAGIEKIRFICSVYCEENERLNFSSVDHTDIFVTVGSSEYHCRVSDVHNGQSMVAMELYLYKSDWKIRVITSEVHKNISDICGDYGVAVE